MPEDLGDWAAQRGVVIQCAVQLLRREAVGQGLGACPVVDPHEGVVGHGVAGAVGGQPVTPRHQLEGTACRRFARKGTVDSATSM